MATNPKNPEFSPNHDRPSLTIIPGGGEVSSSTFSKVVRHLRRPSIERANGVMELESRFKDNESDLIFALTGEAFLRNVGFVQEQYSRFAQSYFGWSSAYSDEFARSALGVGHLTKGLPLKKEVIEMILEDPIKRKRIPDAAFYRPKNGTPGIYTGMIASRMLFPIVSLAEKPDEQVSVQYQIIRAFHPDQRAKGRGRQSINLERMLHQDADPEKHVHRTPGYVAGFATHQSSALEQESGHPWVEPFVPGTRDWAIEQVVARILGTDPALVDLNGVIRNFYKEPNLSVYKYNERGELVLNLREGHEDSLRFANTMYGHHEGEYGMGPFDAIMPMHTFRNKNGRRR